MGLLDKLKSVLFEEEEIEIPIAPNDKKKEKLERKQEKHIKEELPKTNENDVKIEKIDLKTIEEESRILPKKRVEETTSLDVLERDVFASKKTFEFPVFDETDFSDTAKLRRSANNVLEHEKTNRSKRIDFGRYEEKKQVSEKTFRPSPIISPVYGILDQNYKKEDIIPKKNTKNDIVRRTVDIDQIRNKAYGTLEEEIDSMTSSYEDEINISGDVEIESDNNIDDLLLDSIDETVTLGDMMEREDTYEDINTIDLSKEIKPNNRSNISKTIDILDEIESEMDQNKSVLDKLESDTIESDLFNLIDSMYESREEGE